MSETSLFVHAVHVSDETNSTDYKISLFVCAVHNLIVYMN